MRSHLVRLGKTEGKSNTLRHLLILYIGIGAGFKAAWDNSGKASDIKQYVDSMVKNQASGYQKLQQVTDEYQNIIPDMVKCLEYEDYIKATDGTNGYIPFRDFSLMNDENNNKRAVSKSVMEKGSAYKKIYNAGKAATLLANGGRLANVLPIIQYAGLSNKAMKAKMIKDAVDAANIAKAAGKKYKMRKLDIVTVKS